MFERLGKFVERHWKLSLLFWWLALVGAESIHNGWINNLGLFRQRIPVWKDVAEGSEFAFLPPQMPSLIGEQLLARSFPEDLLRSSIVIVLRRHMQPINAEDEIFIEEVLKPRLEKIRDEVLGDPKLQIKTFKNPQVGRLLVSADKEASLVILSLKTEFLERSNEAIINRIEALLYDEIRTEIDPETQKQVQPVGLDLKISGSATVGRDMLVASDESARSTEFWTVILVVVLLLAIYQAPFLAMIPLVTVYVTVRIALAIVILLTQVPLWNYRVFFGMEVYITVVTYGTGVDYCLFLIARYKEEIDKGVPLPQALRSTLTNVGAAVTASALTVIGGIGMMIFAQFGKFRQAGIGISLSLIVGLFAALTLTPALLRLAGWMAFWPFGRTERIPSESRANTGTSLINRLVERNRYQVVWEHIGEWLFRRPGRILLVSLAAMLPFAVIGLYFHDYLSYGLLSELPNSKKSVEGAKAVQEHFPAGYAGPLTILVRNDRLDFNDVTGSTSLELLIGSLKPQLAALGIADIRYLKEPLGLSYQASLAERIEFKKRAPEFYISAAEGLAGHVSRIDVVFEADPFARESIQQLKAVEQAIATALEDSDLEDLKQGAEIHFVGPTASIRDLKQVTDQDQIRIDVLVLLCVFLILVALLRRPAVSAYLIVSVFFSYFATLGVTFVVYWLLDPAEFGGLDWKVPMFLFVILMAIGEDYNIFLMTRIEEEQRRNGPVEGVRIAMLRTGTIISSCGIIMAGTFLSLLFGTLVGLKQLGFALAFGVLLDTFVVRPLLVPAYLILLYQGKFGRFSRFLGGIPPVAKANSKSRVKG